MTVKTHKSVIWISSAVSGSGNIVGVLPYESTRPAKTDGRSDEERAAAFELEQKQQRLMCAGGAVEVGTLNPTWAFNLRNARGAHAPPFMSFSGVPAVTEAMKIFLEDFDLGDTRFHPIRIWDAGQKQEPWPEKFFVMNVANQRATVDVSEMDHPAFARDFMTGKNELPLIVQQAELLRTLPSALDGPDLWMDPSLVCGLFLSDRLARAIGRSGLSRGWLLMKTQLQE